MRLRVHLTVAAIAAVAALLVLPGAALALEQKVVPSDGAAFDAFGQSVDVDGDTAVVGAQSHNGGRGAAYVYKRLDDAWTQTAKLTATDSAANDFFGNSVAIDGDTIVVAARRNDGVRGALYTFTRTGGDRTESAKLTVSDGAANDGLGASVAIDGDTIVAGADEADNGEGAVYTFAGTGANRTQTAKLTASDALPNDRLGLAVAIDGDTIVAGAPNDDVGPGVDPGVDQGSVRTFTRTGANRTQTATLTVSDGEGDDGAGGPGDGLGTSVAIDGDTIVAGAPNVVEAEGQFSRGAAYTFAAAGAEERNETAKLTASDGADFASLGTSVAIGGDTVLVGNVDLNNSFRGTVYRYARVGGDRAETTKLTAPDADQEESFGSSMAIDGDTIIIGANGPGPMFDSPGFALILFEPDGDDDGVSDAADNCPEDPNPAQADVDGDGIGDVCDPRDDRPVVPDPPVVPPPGSGCPAGTSAGVVCAPSGNGLAMTGTAGADRFVGTAGNDTIRCGVGDDVVFAGTGDDVIRCGAGNDTIEAGQGNDFVDGESGNDGIKGGPGTDRLLGGSGNDTVSGNSGNDVIIAGSGGDRASGNEGRDRIVGGSGNDRLLGNEGRDRLVGGSGRDRLRGGSGNDSISGGRGQDRISGNAGDDRLNGNNASDRIVGNSGDDRISGGRTGNDRLAGGSGNDVLRGGAGKDRLLAGTGRDRLFGGPGRDVLNTRDRRRGDLANCGPGRDFARVDRGDRASRCERIRRR